MSEPDIDLGEEARGSVRTGLDSRYLSNLDLRGYGDVKLTIERVFKRKVHTFRNGGKKEGIAVTFAGKDKALILSRTNENALVRLFNSANPKDWIGKEVTLYADPDFIAFGEKTGRICIREK